MNVHSAEPLEAPADPNALVALARGLTQTSTGLWTTPASRALSYPEGEHDHLVRLEDRSFWFRHRNRCLVDFLARHPPAGTLLDVGAGNGFVTRGLIEAGRPAVALEPSPAGAAHARSRGLAPVIRATLQDADFPVGSLPAVGLFDVLEHVEDRRGLLAHVRERLRPSGRLYLTVPALGWLWSSEDVRAGHFLRYTRTTLRSELEQAGFRVEACRYFFSWLVPAVLGLRVTAERLGLRRSSPEALARDLSTPRPAVSVVVDALGAAERAWMAAGLPQGLGTSLFAVATPG